jgi:hypothetical protein
MNRSIALIVTSSVLAAGLAGCSSRVDKATQVSEPGTSITQAPEQPQTHPQRGPACRLPRCPQ